MVIFFKSNSMEYQYPEAWPDILPYKMRVKGTYISVNNIF
jgi:hypothetical protein